MSEAWEELVTHVRDRNISYISKSEWEQYFMLLWIKEKYSGKMLVSLTPSEIYEIADEFKIDFTKVSNMIVKCRRFEDCNEISKFEDLVDKQAIQNLNFDKNLSVQFKVVNKVALEDLRRILNLNNIFSDTSFSRDILTMSIDSFYILTKKSSQKSIGDIIREKKEGLKSIMDEILGKDESKSVMEKIDDEIKKKNTLKTLSGLFTFIKAFIGIPENAVSCAKQFFLDHVLDNEKIKNYFSSREK